MQLSVSAISKSYGAEEVLSNVSFVLGTGQRAGLVGANGAGKSTLLKIIVGEVEPDCGNVTLPTGIEIGYLAQTTPVFAGETIDDLVNKSQGDVRCLEACLRRLEQEISRASGDDFDSKLAEYDDTTQRFERRGGYDLDYRIDQVLHGLGIGHIPRDRNVATLSGGEKARVGLATLLLKSPDILLLDEPTNHLDVSALEWLEAYLAAYKGMLLAASHDRHFLGGIANVILEINERTRAMQEYAGNYDFYVESKRRERERWQEEYRVQQEEIKALRQEIREKARQVGHTNRAPRDNDKFAAGFFGGRLQRAISRNVASAEEKLRRIEANPVPKPPQELRISPEFDPLALGGTNPLTASGIYRSYGGRSVLEDISLSLGKDSHVVIVGPNGAGKSTLLKILAGHETPDAGDVWVTRSARIGYLSQGQETLDPRQTLLEAYREGLIGSQEELLADLFRYGFFSYEDLAKQVGQLSVGQRQKLQLARLLAQRANLLLLDEPTNHVSLDVLEDFEQALVAFPGSIIAASHDRRFIERFGGEVWELQDGRLVR
jgi:macrolide transport system ATP-binding/permease protein